MPPGSRSVKVEILGDARGARKAVKDTDDALGKLAVTGRASAGPLRVVGTGLKGIAVAAAGAAAAGALALGAIGKSVVQTGIQYQNSLNQMQAVSHATAGQMGQVAQRARDLGNDLTLPATSAADAATAMVELAKGNLSAAQAMDAAKGTLTLAAAAQVDGATAATIQADALNAFSLKADQAGHVADVLANAANSATGEITDFAEGLQASSAVAHQFGVSLDDTVTTLALFANAGIKGSDAGTSLKTMLIALAHPSGQAAAAMKKLGVNAFDAQGNFVGLENLSGQLAAAQGRLSVQAFNAAAATAFGSDAVRAASVLAKSGAAGFDQMAAAVGKAGGASAVAKAQMQGVGGALQGLQSQLETVKIDVFTREAPNLERFIRALSDRLPGAAERGLKALDDLTALVQREVPRAKQQFLDFSPALQQYVTGKLQLASQAATQVFAPALRGAGTVLHAVADEAATVGRVVDSALSVGLGGAAKVAQAFETEAHGLADTVHSVGDSLDRVGREVLPVAKGSLQAAGGAASALVTSLTGASRIIAPFTGEILLAVGAVKAAQLATTGWTKASAGIARVTSAWGAFADKAALAAGLATEKVSVKLGSDMPAAAARGEKAMVGVRSALTGVGGALPLVGVGLAAVGYAMEQQAQQAQANITALQGLNDQLRQGGNAADQARAKLAGLQQKTGTGFGLGGQLAQQMVEAKNRSDEAYQALSEQEKAALAVSAAQAHLASVLRDSNGDTAAARDASAAYQQALRDQRNLQLALTDATNGSKTSLEDYTDALFGAANANTALASAEISIRQSELSLVSSHAAAADAADRYGKNSQQAKEASASYEAAQLTLRSQILGAAEAAKRAAVANDKSGSSAHAAAAGAVAQRDELAKLAAGIAPGSSLRRFLDQLIRQLDAFARDRTAHINVVTQYSQTGIQAGLVGHGPQARASGGPAGGLTLVGEKGPELVNLPRGSYVFDAVTSKRMLAGAGRLGLNYDLDAGRSALVRAFNSQNTALKKIGAVRQVILDRLATVQGKLRDLLRDRADYAAAARDAANSYAAITGATQRPGDQGLVTADVVKNLQTRLQAIRAFAANVERLRRLGLDRRALDQIVQAGGEGGGATAAALVAGGKSAVNQVNALEAQIYRASSALGNSAAASMYNAGIQAAQGLIRGLSSQQHALSALMAQIAKGLVRDIRRALGIRSPSAEMAEQVGKWLPLGIAVGVKNYQHIAQDSVVSMLGGAVPTYVGGGYASAAPAGRAGAHVVLEVHSGGSQLDDLLVEILRKYVRVRGGDVQTVLGRG